MHPGTRPTPFRQNATNDDDDDDDDDSDDDDDNNNDDAADKNDGTDDDDDASAAEKSTKAKESFLGRKKMKTWKVSLWLKRKDRTGELLR